MSLGSNPHNGTYGVNALLGQPGPIPGQLGTTFDGLTSTSRVAITVTPGVTSSIEAWFYVDGTSVDGFQTIIMRGSPGAGLGIYDTGVHANHLDFFFAGTEHFNTTPISFNAWHHVVIAINGGNGTFYVDGVADGTFTGYPGGIVFDGIGQGASDREVFHGTLSKITVYNYALTAPQAAAHSALRIAPQLRNDILYVHTVSGAHPDTQDALVANFNLYFSTETIQLSINGIDIPFTPLLEDRSSVSLEQQAEDPLFGIKNIQQGTLSIVNYNGFLSRMYAKFYWKNKKTKVYLGGTYNGKVLPFSEYHLLSTWLLADIASGEFVSTVKLVSQTSVLQKMIPVTPYDPATVPNADSGVVGSFMPIWYGRNTVRPDLIDASGLGIYRLADPTYQTMFSVDAVRGISKSTGAPVGLQPTDYTVSLTACTVTITNALYAPNLYTIEVTATGKPDGAGSYIKLWADIVVDILVTFCNQKLATDFDLASLANAQVKAPAELAVYLKTQTDILSIFQSGGVNPSLERSVMARLDSTETGTWVFQVWSSPTQFTNADITLLQHDFLSFEPRPKLDSVFYKVIVLYDFNYARKEWQSVTAVSNRTRYANSTEDVVFIYTNLKSSNDATIVAQRYRYLWSQIPLEIIADEIGIKTLNSRIGAVAAIYYAPAPNLAKAFSGNLFTVTGLKRVFSKPPRMTLTLNDLRGAPGNIGFWTDAFAPTWASATNEQRNAQGFWTDSLGRADPLDPTSANVSLWW